MTGPPHNTTCLCVMSTMLHVTQVSGVCGPPQMMSTDKDFCFMATNDLMMELQMDSIKPDESEQKVVKSVLWLLEDKNADLAVRR